MIQLTDLRLYALYLEASRRNLRITPIDACTVRVSSSRPDCPPYEVRVTDAGAECECLAATNGQACTHVAAAVAYLLPLVELRWHQRNAEEWIYLRHKMLARLPLSDDEQRLVKRCVREVEKRFTSEKVERVREVCPF